MSNPHESPYEDIIQTIGWTPLVRLKKVTGDLVTPVYGKAEFFNPGGSIKDRIGPAIISEAERRGDLKPGGTIVEGTSGNTGIALALAATAKGYHCIFTMPDKMSKEKVKLLRAFGAEVIVTPTAVPPDHPDNYVMKAKQIVRETPNAVLANQFYNETNPQAHYESTGPEIWRQTGGRVTHFVASAGTGGTVSGVGRYLKEQNPAIRIIAGDPVGSMYAAHARNEEIEPHPYKVEGIGGDKIPSVLHYEHVDEFVSVSDAEAFQVARRVTREEGMFVGGSAGFNVAIALRVAAEVNDPEAMIVTVLCDTGERYLSKLYSDDWMRENQMIEPETISAADLLAGKDAAAPKLIDIAPGGTVRQAINLMSTFNVSQLPVIVDADCVGSVTEGDLMARAISEPAVLEQSVDDNMEKPYPVVDGGASMDMLSSLLSHDTPAVLVRTDGHINGIVTRLDLLRKMAGIR